MSGPIPPTAQSVDVSGPTKYAETLDALQYAPGGEDAAAVIASVSCRLVNTGDGEAAAVVDGLSFALKRIARLLETRGGVNEPQTDHAYRIAMYLTT